MKRFVFAVALVGLLAAGVRTAPAGEYGQHWYAGTDGLKAGSLDAPGFQVKMRVPYYYANRWADDSGDKQYYKREIFFVEPEFGWASRDTVLGARFAAGVAMPLAYHIEDMAVKSDTTSRNHVTLELGDLRVTPLMLGWERERFDITAGYTFFAPTGDFEGKPAPRPGKAAQPDTGKGYWTHMLNLGGTWYITEDRSWHLSAMTHYEFHTRQDKTRVDWGDNLHVEWGLGKDFCSGWSVGAVGYASVQTTDDRIPGVKGDGQGRRVFAAGLEVGYRRPQSALPWFATVRGAQEFGVKGHTRGFRSMLTAGLNF